MTHIQNLFFNFRRRKRRKKRCVRFSCDSIHHCGTNTDEEEPFDCDTKPANIIINNIHVNLIIKTCKCDRDSNEEHVLTVSNKEINNEKWLKIIENILKKKKKQEEFEVTE